MNFLCKFLIWSFLCCLLATRVQVWGNKFCKRTCKDAYLHEVSLDRNIIRRWVSLPSRRILSNSSPRLTAFSDATLIQSYQNFATRFEPLVRSTSPLTGLRIAARPIKS